MQQSRRKFFRNAGLATTGLLGASSLSAARVDPGDVHITGVKTFRVRRGIFVKVETNVGISGWGEASSNSPTQTVAGYVELALRKQLIDQNPFNTDYLWEQMFWQNHDHGPSGVLTYAIGGVDLALWYLKGKILNVPIYQLLGGTFRKFVPSYCGIPLRGGKVSVEEAIDRAQKVVNLGFKIVKLRMQIREYNLDPTPDPTLRYYEKVRAVLPSDVELFVDPNEGYSAGRAVQIGRALEKMGMRWFESPVPREANADLRTVVDALDLTVLAGEKCYNRWEIRDLILQGNPDVIQPDVLKAGGISEMQRMASLAHVHFKRVAPHNTKPTLGTAAAAEVKSFQGQVTTAPHA
ncbi:MAG: mandelate racemase/muconate lactonizing enzyme family protein, partial [Bacteroidota bacterium]